MGMELVMVENHLQQGIWGASATAVSAPVSFSNSPSPWISPPSFSLTLQSWPKGCALLPLFLQLFHPVPPFHLPHTGGQAILRSRPLSAKDKAHCQLSLNPVP